MSVHEKVDVLHWYFVNRWMVLVSYKDEQEEEEREKVKEEGKKRKKRRRSKLLLLLNFKQEVQ